MEMQTISASDDLGNIQTMMAGFGALCIVIFLFAPMTGGQSGPGSMIYMVAGSGEQWPMLLFAFLSAFLVYYRLFLWASVAGIGVLLTSMPVIWQILKTDLFSPAIPASIYSYPHHSAVGLSALHFLALSAGILLLCAASGWGIWLEWKGKRRHALSATVLMPRRFDPRAINPQATIGFCYFCGTKNPLSRNQCLQCSANLSWMGSALPAVSSKPVQPAKPKQDFWAMSPIDWTVWGVGIISFIAWPLGLILFFVYSRNGDDKGNAALIGACVALLIFVARLVYTMSTVGHLIGN